MEITNGALHTYGNMTQILNAPGQGQVSSVVIVDPNDDRGANLFFHGYGLPDIRYTYLKDKVAGYTGVVPSHFVSPTVCSADYIPAAVQTNNICAAQAVVNGTAMVLAGASTGIAVNIPIIPFVGYGGLNGGTAITTGLALDFGFAFGNVTANNTTITVADSTQFLGGMPLVIAGVGNAAGTAPLLTNVASTPTPTTITVFDTPLATNAAAPIGTGNLWGPSENGFPTPSAALPYLSDGPDLLLDPQQCGMRGVQITGTAGGNSGGTFIVNGYDSYGMVLSALVTVAAGASTGWSLKTFKYIVSVIPQFTDGANTYTVGTSDVFSFVCRSDRWENTNIFFNAVVAPTSLGWVTADLTAATNATGDVRGTVQTSTNGAGSGFTGGAASNGTVVSLAMSGRRLVMFQDLAMYNVVRGTITNTKTIFGNTQA